MELITDTDIRTKETIDRLRVSGAGIIRTDESGAITVKTDGKKYGVEVFR